MKQLLENKLLYKWEQVRKVSHGGIFLGSKEFYIISNSIFDIKANEHPK
jgi:hypothetical protein